MIAALVVMLVVAAFLGRWSFGILGVLMCMNGLPYLGCACIGVLVLTYVRPPAQYRRARNRR